MKISHGIDAANHATPASNPLRITIVAISARWLAESCVRAGWQPAALDLFGDHDLRQCCPARQLSGLQEAVLIAGQTGEPVLFGTGFEQLVHQVPEHLRALRILNTPARSVVACRNVAYWSGLLKAGGHEVPEYSLNHSGIAGKITPWLVKPVIGAGGVGIRRWSPDHDSGKLLNDFLQECVAGMPASLVAVADGKSAKILGCFRQIVGDTEFGASGEFVFAGTVGPVAFAEPVCMELESIARAIATGCGLRGLFGIDFVVRDNRPVVIEINPRPTASCELLELATQTSLLPVHVHALGEQPKNDGLQNPEYPDRSTCFGKAYVFSALPGSVVIPEKFQEWLIEQQCAGTVADIPESKSVVASQTPIATVYASGPDCARVLELLRQRAAEIQEWFAGSQ